MKTLNFKDLLLLVASLLAIVVGIAWPAIGEPFQPYPVYSMMALLFFSFLPIRFGTILSSVRHSLFGVGYCVAVKLILLPLLAYFSFRYFFPKYALAALLLSGISAGVASPFFADLVQANISLVFGIVVLSSVLVPFTLPALAHLCVGKEMEISLLGMSRLLGLVIFCPLVLSELLKRFVPAFSAKLARVQYPISLASFVVTNLGIFSQYAAFLRNEPLTVMVAIGVSSLLAAAYFLSGVLFSVGRALPDHLATIISFGIINNVLVVVLSSKFFSPIETTVAAMYTVPFFFLIIPLRLYRNWAGRRGRARTG